MTEPSYSYRLIVLVKGHEDQRIDGPWRSDKTEAENELETIIKAKQGGGALVSLPWMTVQDDLISAAFIQERAHMPPSVPKAGPPRYRSIADMEW